MRTRILVQVLATAALAAGAWASWPVLFAVATGPSPAAPSPAPTPSPAASPIASPSPPPVAFIDTALPAWRATRAGRTEVVHVFVGNTGDKPVKATVRGVLRTTRGRAVDRETIVECAIGAGDSARRVPVALELGDLQPEDYPLGGWLFLESGGKVVQKLEIKTVAGPPDGGDWPLVKRALIAASWCMGLAAAWLVLYTPRGLGVLFRRMGTPTWSFTESWSSTLTIAGAVLTSLLTYAALPEHGHTFSRKGYALLSLLLGAVIALAPGVYNLFRQPVEGSNPVRYRGIVLMFLAAGVLSMTGGLAQIALVRALISDTAVAGLMSTRLSEVFGYLCQGLQVILWIYGLLSAIEIVKAQTAPAARRAGLEAAREAAPPLPAWPLL